MWAATGAFGRTRGRMGNWSATTPRPSRDSSPVRSCALGIPAALIAADGIQPSDAAGGGWAQAHHGLQRTPGTRLMRSRAHARDAQLRSSGSDAAPTDDTPLRARPVAGCRLFPRGDLVPTGPPPRDASPLTTRRHAPTLPPTRPGPATQARDPPRLRPTVRLLCGSARVRFRHPRSRFSDRARWHTYARQPRGGVCRLQPTQRRSPSARLLQPASVGGHELHGLCARRPSCVEAKCKEGGELGLRGSSLTTPCHGHWAMGRTSIDIRPAHCSQPTADSV
jgi:hypothetical protein